LKDGQDVIERNIQIDAPLENGNGFLRWRVL